MRLRWVLVLAVGCSSTPARVAAVHGDPSPQPIVRDAGHDDQAHAENAQLASTLDKPRCEGACRNYATLKFWQRADLEIAALPHAKQPTARAAKTEELATKIAAGIDTCVTACLAANNLELATCWIHATTVDQLAACEAR